MMGRVVPLNTLIRQRNSLRKKGKTFVFTNGTFDVLHRGHVEYLAQARKWGDVLAVGLNTDASIRRIKGQGRPINREQDRAAVLAALGAVDFVCLFPEDTPERIISLLKPDVLVKGADWKMNDIVGRDIVEQYGGRVRRIRLTPGRSTSALIKRIVKRFAGLNH